MLTRAFNTVYVDPSLKHLTKTSRNTVQLKNEINYYLSLPSGPASFFPRLLNYKKDYSAYTLDYLPYENLSQLFLEDRLPLHEGQEILKRLLTILEYFHSFTSLRKLSDHTLENYLVKKTLDRLHLLKKSPYFKTLFRAPSIKINNKVYKNFFPLLEEFKEALKRYVYEKPSLTLFHGDFCLSNILYCLQTKDIKLVDPRGSFYTAGLYGNPYYDYAKLMQGFQGGYDNILSNNYTLEEKEKGSFILEVRSSFLLSHLLPFLKNLFLSYAVNTSLVSLIEASLFLSMIPLHYECLQRQKAFFIRGVMLLDKALEESK